MTPPSESILAAAASQAPTVREVKCSAIVLTYNQGMFVRAAIESLLNQSSPVQIVVCDDGSTDGTATIAHEVLSSAGWPNGSKLIVNPSNLGPSRNLELAISNTDHSLIVVNDGDDVSMPKRVETVENLFSSNSVSLIGCAVIPIDENSERITGPFFWRVEEDKIVDAKDVDRYGRWTVLGATMAFRKSMWTAFGSVPAGTLGCDRALTHRALGHEGILLFKEPLVEYRVRTAGLTHWLTYWSVRRPLLTQKLKHYIQNNVGIISDLDTVIARCVSLPTREKLSEIRTSLARENSLLTAVISAPAPRAIRTLSRALFTRDKYNRIYAFKCAALAIDPVRHEMWMRMQLAEIASRLAMKVRALF